MLKKMKERFARRRFDALLDAASAKAFPDAFASSKGRLVLIWAARLLFLVWRRLWKDNCPRQAAALAYQTMLSLVPLTALIIAVGAALSAEWVVDSARNFLEAHLLPDAAGQVGGVIRKLASSVRPKALGVFGAATLVALALTLFFTMEQIINDIFRVKKGRTLWVRATSAVAVILGAPLLFGLSIYFTAEIFVDLPMVVNTVIPLTLTSSTLFLVYWRLPAVQISRRYAAIAAVFAGVALEALKSGFALYVKHAGATLTSLYGAFAILPMFLAWVFLAWFLFLFGAELNAALHEVESHDWFKEVTGMFKTKGLVRKRSRSRR